MVNGQYFHHKVQGCRLEINGQPPQHPNITLKLQINLQKLWPGKSNSSHLFLYFFDGTFISPGKEREQDHDHKATKIFYVSTHTHACFCQKTLNNKEYGLKFLYMLIYISVIRKLFLWIKFKLDATICTFALPLQEKWRGSNDMFLCSTLQKKKIKKLKHPVFHIAFCFRPLD